MDLTVKLRFPLLWSTVFALLLGGISIASVSAGTILGTKHDFTGLNQRVGVVAMSTVAFSDYGSPCVYCHIPPEKDNADTAALGGIPGWNRFLPATTTYDLYDSRTIDNKVRTPSPITLLCLSCHDGTMAVDMTVFQPDTFNREQDAALHLRIHGDNTLMNCGKCHDGKAAHSIEIKHIGTDLQNDHPISMTYAGLTHVDADFRPPDGAYGFDNGVNRNGKMAEQFSGRGAGAKTAHADEFAVVAQITVPALAHSGLNGNARL